MPILRSIDPADPASQTVMRAGAGQVIAPGDEAALVAAARYLRDHPDVRRTCGTNARAYAEANFAMAGIADRFDALFATIVDMSGRRA